MLPGSLKKKKKSKFWVLDYTMMSYKLSMHFLLSTWLLNSSILQNFVSCTWLECMYLFEFVLILLNCQGVGGEEGIKVEQ